jgi:hypothetical protein
MGDEIPEVESLLNTKAYVTRMLKRERSKSTKLITTVEKPIKVA